VNLKRINMASEYDENTLLVSRPDFTSNANYKSAVDSGARAFTLHQADVSHKADESDNDLISDLIPETSIS
jgi:hypothetical protein